MTFAARLKQLRESAGLTQAGLADAAGLTLGGVTKLEQGAREPSLATAQAIAAALKVKVTAFDGVEFTRGESAPAEASPEPTKRGRPRKNPPA